MRELIFNTLKTVAKTHNVGKHTGEILEPTLIIKYNNQLISVSNSKGGFQRFEVICYIPIKSSSSQLDILIFNVKEKLKEVNDVEDTGQITPEFVDNDKKGIMRSVYFRIPKEVR